MDYTDVLNKCQEIFGDEKDSTLQRFSGSKQTDTEAFFIERLREGIEQQPKDAKSTGPATEIFHQERILENVRYIVFVSVRSFKEESIEKKMIKGTVALYVCSGYYIASVSVHDNETIQKKHTEWEKRRSSKDDCVLVDVVVNE